MSYVFDTLSKAWARTRAKLPADVQGTEVVTRFEMLLEELHDANHRLHDAVNKDERCRRFAERLDAAMHKEDES